MKLDSFRQQLRTEVDEICRENNWNYDDAKQRGMAFENWCFNLFTNMYQESDNRIEDCVFRGNDFNIDIAFTSKEYEEVFYIQSKFDKPAASDPIDSGQVEELFNRYELLFKPNEFDPSSRGGKVVQLFNEAKRLKEENYKVHFVFISTGKTTENIKQIERHYNSKFLGDNVSFAVWDLSRVRDEYVAVNRQEESYPDEIKITLGEGKFLDVDGPEQHLTFVVAGAKLSEIFAQYKQSLFNWNIRSFLGKKGEVNKGMTETIKDNPETFYYLNNGISALCDEFEFNRATRQLTIRKLQVVNGAQTMGALGSVHGPQLSNLQVLVKLTAVKHAVREKGLAAQIIRANNTQNTLRVPDFKSNDQIQLWLERKFAETKPKGELGKIVYGRKRPYPRANKGTTPLKMLDFAKIRYAWEHEPRTPISAPNKLFIGKDQRGVYEDAFGDNGKLVEIWSDGLFDEALLAIHCHHFCDKQLKQAEVETFDLEIAGEKTEVPYGQISRLKFYALRCMRIFADDYLHLLEDIERQELYAVKGKFNTFCKSSFRTIKPAVCKAYREVIKNKDGAAFSLPRDNKIWQEIQDSFKDNCDLIFSR